MEDGALPRFALFAARCRDEQAAALPPSSAPRSKHAARFEGSVPETPRAAADRAAAHHTPKLPEPQRRPDKKKGQLCSRRSARPIPTARGIPDIFLGRRKMFVLMCTTWGGPGFRLRRVVPLLQRKLSRAGESTPRNVPRGTFTKRKILKKQCSTWNICVKSTLQKHSAPTIYRKMPCN